MAFNLCPAIINHIHVFILFLSRKKCVVEALCRHEKHWKLFLIGDFFIFFLKALKFILQSSG